ncbi:unnamed protein product [Notodromas monacha]|uniref:SET domain-containing protein n=1 Tax=Notodromas monacha TaxID=399045 RepID=A0A7R9BLJ8_9CRUS|nr:unnamed protein product [Notodromas monacha]CAG0916871.1 unnamed protein product [Notodromas monacha]
MSPTMYEEDLDDFRFDHPCCDESLDYRYGHEVFRLGSEEWRFEDKKFHPWSWSEMSFSNKVNRLCLLHHSQDDPGLTDNGKSEDVAREHLKICFHVLNQDPLNVEEGFRHANNALNWVPQKNGKFLKPSDKRPRETEETRLKWVPDFGAVTLAAAFVARAELFWRVGMTQNARKDYYEARCALVSKNNGDDVALIEDTIVMMQFKEEIDAYCYITVASWIQILQDNYSVALKNISSAQKWAKISKSPNLRYIQEWEKITNEIQRVAEDEHLSLTDIEEGARVKIQDLACLSWREHPLVESDPKYAVNFIDIINEQYDDITGGSEYDMLHSAVDVRYSSKKGRHLVAKRNIPAGAILVYEAPFFALVDPSRMLEFCHRCKKRLGFSQAHCPTCVYTRYCDSYCKSQDYYHPYECQYMGYFRSRGDLDLEFAGRLTELYLDIMAIPKTYYQNYRSRELDRCHDAVETAVLMGSAGRDKPESPLMTRLRAKIIFHLKCNLAGYKFQLPQTEFVPGKVSGKTDSFGTALLNYGMLFNHSCTYGCTWDFVSGKFVFRTLVPFSCGEELTINCGVNFTTDVREERKFFNDDGITEFTCECEACCENWPLVQFQSLHQYFDLSICPSCKSNAVSGSTCDDCKADLVPEQKKLKDLSLVAEDAVKLLQDFRITDAEKLLVDAINAGKMKAKSGANHEIFLVKLLRRCWALQGCVSVLKPEEMDKNFDYDTL